MRSPLAGSRQGGRPTTTVDVRATDREPIDLACRHARRTRVAQGLPAHVTDAQALDTIVGLINGDLGAA
jgi:hypothetical protein